MKKRKPLAPRNPLVVVARFKQAGAHGKPEKAKRRANAVSVGREVNSIGRVSGFYPEGYEFEPRASHHAKNQSFLLCASMQGVCA